MCANFLTKRTTLTFLTQICPKKYFSLEIQKSKVWIRINILEIPFVPIFSQKRGLWLLRPKFAQKWILRSEFKNLSLDSESVPPLYHVFQISVKMENLKSFGVNFVKLPIYMRIFVLIPLRVFQRAGWRLKWAGWRWVDVGGLWNETGGAGWRWMDLGGDGITVK